MNGDGLLLQTRGLCMAFGGLKIFDGLDFSMTAGERHAIIGPNGAGKSTFVNIVTGLLAPTGGTLWLEGRDITRTSPQRRVHAGVARTYQINTLFPALNPLESVVLALAQRDGVARPTWRSVSRMTGLIDEGAALLARFGLADAAMRRTELLAYGEQRLLEVVLAMALRPKLLILDEPAAGLSSSQGVELFEQIAALTAGTSALFIEHDMHIVFRFADRVSVFAGGLLVATGQPEQIKENPRVKEAYLG